jgi:hypothetical protein
MNELYNFLKKSTSHLNSITFRSSYGLNCVFAKEKAFLLVTNEQRIGVYIENKELLAKLEKSISLNELVIDNKALPNWYLIPINFNKKKNKLVPIINYAYDGLFIKNKRKNKRHKPTKKIIVQKNKYSKSVPDHKKSFLRYLINLFK